jgi:hypothetical protein
MFGPSWVPDFAAQETLSPSNPQLKTNERYHLVRLARRVSFQDLDSTLSILGLLLDSIETAIELNDSPDLLITQIPELEHLMKRALLQTIPSSAPWFKKLKKSEDIFSILAGGRNEHRSTFANLRSQYDALIKRAELLSRKPGAPSEAAGNLSFLIHYVLLGRFFFATNMGFVGVVVTRVCKNDVVTHLFEENLPIILRPRLNSYVMVGAAHVSES